MRKTLLSVAAMRQEERIRTCAQNVVSSFQPKILKLLKTESSYIYHLKILLRLDILHDEPF